MSLQMIYGKGGSGKSHEIYRQIQQRMALYPDRDFIILVPEQYTFRSEQKVLKELGQRSVFRVSVLSFNTLVKKILSTVGGSAHDLISDNGKIMLMTKVLGEVKDDMSVFKGVAGKAGFVAMAKNLVDEIRRFDLDPESLRGVAKTTEDKELKQKLQDILLIHDRYDQEVHRDHIDATDEIHFALDRIEGAGFLKNSEVYLDEFNDFSVMQLKFITALLHKARRVVLTLTLPPSEGSSDVFQITRDTERKLLRAAEDAGVSLEKPLELSGEPPARFRENPELAHLESEYFHYPSRSFGGPVRSLTLYKAQNSYDEVERVAKDIRRRIREDESLRYRDLAILCRNIDSYENIVTTVFREYDIPVFLDKRRDMDNSPLVQYLLAFILIAAEGYTYEALFRMLKTGLSPVATEDIDLLENYILAHGIKGGNFQKEWVYPYPQMKDELGKNCLAQVNASRTQIVDFYSPWVEKIRQAGSARETTRLLFTHLEEDGILDRYIALVDRTGSLEIMKEREEVQKGLVKVMDDLVTVLGDEPLTLEVYAEVMKQAMQNQKIALIPLTLDQVILGDVARVKSDSIHGLYILGVNDGVFPRAIAEEGIITDRDIRKLKEAGLEVFLDSKTRAVYEQFMVYTAFTIPKGFLAISYVGADLEGKSLRPSLVVGRVKKLFPALVEEVAVNPLDHRHAGLEEVEGKTATFNQLIQEMRRNYQGDPVQGLWGEAFRWFQEDPAFSARLKIAKDGLNYTNTALNLSRASVKALYGDQLYLSVSRLERFTACPFAYYVEYGLKAKDRKIHEITPPDVGQLMHTVIDQFTEDLKGMEGPLTSLDRKAIRQSVDELVDRAIAETNTIYKSSARYQHMGEKVKRILHRSVETLTNQIAKGSFVPMFNELAFEKDGKLLPPLSVEIPETGEDALLMGRIDRVDVMELDGRSYIRIIDYKSSAKNMSMKDVFYGLQLQLLVYLEVILRNWESILAHEAAPGAILYFKMDNPLIQGSVGMTDEEIELEVLKNLKLKGMLLKDARVIRSMDKDMDGYSLIIPARFNKEGEVVSSANRPDKNREMILTEEEFGILRGYVMESIGQILKELFEGNIAITPYKDQDKIPCTYCTYRSICQFDTKIAENHYRSIKALPIEELWNRMKGGEAHGQSVDE